MNLAKVRQGGSITADGITLETGMQNINGDKQHAFTSKAKSGAGTASGIGVAGTLALTISTTDVRSTIAAGDPAGGSVTLADGTDANSDAGELKLTAFEDAKNTGQAEPTVNAGKFGFGASVAFAVPTHQVIAEVDDNGVINGAKDVTIQAKSNLDVNSIAKAGVKSGLALSPVVAVSLVEERNTLARLGTGKRALTGNLSVTSEHTGNAESHAAGSVESTDAAIGLSVAVTRTEEDTRALLERYLVVAGNITVDAKGLHDDSADGPRAAANGAKDKESDTSNKRKRQQEGRRAGEGSQGQEEQSRHAAEEGNRAAARLRQRGVRDRRIGGIGTRHRRTDAAQQLRRLPQEVPHLDRHRVRLHRHRRPLRVQPGPG